MTTVDERHLGILGQMLRTLNEILATEKDILEVARQNNLILAESQEFSQEILETLEAIEALMTKGGINIQFQRTMPPASIDVTYENEET